MKKTLAICLLLSTTAAHAFVLENTGTKKCTVKVTLLYKHKEVSDAIQRVIVEIDPQAPREISTQQGEYNLHNIHAIWKGETEKNGKDHEFTKQELDQLSGNTHAITIGSTTSTASTPTIAVTPKAAPSATPAPTTKAVAQVTPSVAKPAVETKK